MDTLKRNPRLSSSARGRAALSVGATAGLAASLAATGCTGQLPGSFRLAQQEQTFSSIQEVNTKVDLLWVVDNSASMDIAQEKLRLGFDSFARKYMQPTWDIRAAVITTDTYIANPAFSGYLATKIPGTTGYTSSYIQGRLSTWSNPSWNPSLVNKTTGAFDGGVKFGELVPVWGPSFSRLLPGLHDGPIPGLCFEALPYFYRGMSQCTVRDAAGAPTGPSKCVSPGPSELSVSQCVNTVQNNTVRSGKAIINTLPPEGVAGDAAWTNALVRDFIVNVTTGSVGNGSERGLGSVLQLLDDNEGTSTAFFRQGSIRAIIFVSDEEDQTMTLPSPVPAGFNPWSYYRCDQAGLISLNGSAAVTGTNGYCCSEAAKNCSYGKEGTSCPSKTVDGLTYTPSLCPREDMLMPVSSVKSRLDSFFLALDGTAADPEAKPGYFVVSIVPLTAQAIQEMQSARTSEDSAVGAIRTFAVDRGDRYLELGNLAGNGSLAMNIADSDYTPILDAIGRSIIEKRASFRLDRAPTGAEDMIVKVIHADGTSEVVTSDKFAIVGKTLQIIDLNFVLRLSYTDRVVINYQPKTVN